MNDRANLLYEIAETMAKSNLTLEQVMSRYEYRLRGQLDERHDLNDLNVLMLSDAIIKLKPISWYYGDYQHEPVEHPEVGGTYFVVDISDYDHHNTKITFDDGVPAHLKAAEDGFVFETAKEAERATKDLRLFAKNGGSRQFMQ